MGVSMSERHTQAGPCDCGDAPKQRAVGQCEDRSALRAAAALAGLTCAAAPVFSDSSSIASVNQPELWKPKTGDSNSWTADKSFSAHSAKLFTQPRDLLGDLFLTGNLYL